jgi:DnaJ-class molecular chaperone
MDAANTTYPCTRCNGTGRLSAFSNVLGGVCFKCHGSGKQAAKPAAKAVRWAVFGIDRNTGGRVRLYNVSAKNEATAIQRARNIMAGASAAFKEQFTLDGAFAITAEQADAADAQDMAITEYLKDRANSGQAALAH